MCACVQISHQVFFFFVKRACLTTLKHSCLSVCVHVCPFIDVCEGPSRGAKSKASGHNWVTGTGDGLKHG